ncbi:MAG: TerB N-terminal domain-containing protein [Oscillospiraceae bacterium]|nr:TerB N-terminal domain-containing protein [Oscillospiraceae bacterium]
MDPPLADGKSGVPSALSDDLYYEIEYESCPIPGVGRFVPRSQKITEPEPDAIRDLFGQMRELGRMHRSGYGFLRTFDGRAHPGSARIFYEQGRFLEDFTDDYMGGVPFSQYYPCYQMMGYEQLRTYFTWRTEIRKGTIREISLSYAFLYIYELLSNIGVTDPEDGLTKLMWFWKAFRVYHTVIDKYVLQWLKAYHIYYELPQSFQEFVKQNGLAEYYPEVVANEDDFQLFSAISKYDIRKSAFFSEDRVTLIADCFSFVLQRLRQICARQEISFDEAIFQPTKMSTWTPFTGALFYPWMEQPDRRVVLSEREIYVCEQNRWMFSTAITTESGRQLVGYIMKQTESALRKAVGYKHRLSADLNVAHLVVERLYEVGYSLETFINTAVLEFYREATKTVVQVDPGALSMIRREALVTQEKLIVSEPEAEDVPEAEREPAEMPEGAENMFSEIERRALAMVLSGEMELKTFSDEHGIMLEVLADGINEKAVDILGDSVLDEEFVLYEEYREQVEEWIR